MPPDMKTPPLPGRCSEVLTKDATLGGSEDALLACFGQAPDVRGGHERVRPEGPDRHALGAHQREGQHLSLSGLPGQGVRRRLPRRAQARRDADMEYLLVAGQRAARGRRQPTRNKRGARHRTAVRRRRQAGSSGTSGPTPSRTGREDRPFFDDDISDVGGDR